jgi:hypothetical protein
MDILIIAELPPRKVCPPIFTAENTESAEWPEEGFLSELGALCGGGCPKPVVGALRDSPRLKMHPSGWPQPELCYRVLPKYVNQNSRNPPPILAA